MLNRACGLYGNIPKMNTKKQRLCVRKRGKTLSQVPSRPFFPLEKELPEKNVTIFLFGFLLPYSVYITIFFHNKNIFQLCILLIFTKNYVIPIK